MARWAIFAGSAVGLVLGGPLGALAGAVVGGAIGLAMPTSPPTGTEARSVGFTIAAVALAAKMASADGQTSEREFAAFERLFRVPEAERANAARFWRLARSSPHGFEAYARQAADLLEPGSPVLEDLLEALLLIATADGIVVADELAFLDRVAGIFGFSGYDWQAIKARHVSPGPDDPWRVLGLLPGATLEQVKAAYRRLARAAHPDRHLAGGTPPEFIRVAEDRMSAINAAYAKVRAELRRADGDTGHRAA